MNISDRKLERWFERQIEIYQLTCDPKREELFLLRRNELKRIFIVLYCLNPALEDLIEFRICAITGELDKLKTLLENGRIPNLQEELDYNFRHACRHGQLKIAEFLGSKGAGKNMLNLVLSYQFKRAKLDIVKYLVSQGANPSRSFHLEENDDIEDFEVVKYLLSLGAQFDYLPPKVKQYLAFCEKIEKRIPERAQKKIYFWIIPKLYDLRYESGQRLMQKNYEKYLELCMG